MEREFVEEALSVLEGTTGSNSSSSDNCLARFIKTYESSPVLWNRLDPNYMNKLKKRKALKKLKVIYREIRPQAKVRDVVRKLNTLRFKYRRELCRIKNEMKNGGEEFYGPNSWVLHSLKFLDVPQEKALSINSNEGQEEPEGEGVNHFNFLQQSDSLSSLTPYHPSFIKENEYQNLRSKQNELLELACDFLSNNHNGEAYDQCLLLGKIWAHKLRNLLPLDREIVEKKVSDIFFKAETGVLLNDSVETNVNRNSTPAPFGSSSDSAESETNYLETFTDL
ncbi:unnamed protein product [Nezara viridula]|uniref:MADF domain-containing protein n=1 Tax=Nezara viridula TaxID=85310 RepID=A0A9P0MY30_NEZVI|nr:unnamed protein product [Nezara viridula]